jgi:hypothetical protein
VRPDSGRPARQPVVLGNAALCQSPARPHGPQYQGPQGISVARFGRAEHGAGYDALGQVVQPLEALAPGDRKVAAVPERVEHSLRRLPVPHSAATLAREVARAESPAGADLLEHVLRNLGMVAQRAFVASPVAAPAHPPAKEREVLDRQQAGLVRPVLEHAPLTEQPGHRALRVDADARGKHDSVTALDRGDRVELHTRQAADGTLHVVVPGQPEPAGETLVGDHVAPQRGQGDRCGRHARYYYSMN